MLQNHAMPSLPRVWFVQHRLQAMKDIDATHTNRLCVQVQPTGDSQFARSPTERSAFPPQQTAQLLYRNAGARQRFFHVDC